MSQSSESLWTRPTDVPHPRPPPVSWSGRPVDRKRFHSDSVVYSTKIKVFMGISRDLVGADNKDDAVHVGLRTHFLFHLTQPTVQSVKTLPETHVIDQQDALTVFIEFITYLCVWNQEKNRFRSQVTECDSLLKNKWIPQFLNVNKEKIQIYFKKA